MVIEEIATDLYRLEIPLSTGRLASTNAYIIKGFQRHLIIDPGDDHKESMDVMLSALDKLCIDIDRSDFFITHSHRDHSGLLWQLFQEGSSVYAHKQEAEIIKGIRKPPLLTNLSQFIIASGFPENDVRKILLPHLQKKGSGNPSAKPLHFRLVEDGNLIHIGEYRFICVHTPGHSEGHMCLYEPQKKLLISGDHLLDTIGSGVSCRFKGNPLGDYLSSLDKIYRLDISQVLPGHRGLFSNYRERITELKELSSRRCQEILSILEDGGLNAYQTAAQMNWNVGGVAWHSLPLFHQLLATEKAAAYLTYLEEMRFLERKLQQDEWIFQRRG